MSLCRALLKEPLFLFDIGQKKKNKYVKQEEWLFQKSSIASANFNASDVTAF